MKINTDSIFSSMQAIIKFPVTKKMFAIHCQSRFTHCLLIPEKASTCLYVFLRCPNQLHCCIMSLQTWNCLIVSLCAGSNILPRILRRWCVFLCHTRRHVMSDSWFQWWHLCFHLKSTFLFFIISILWGKILRSCKFCFLPNELFLQWF